MDASIVFFTMVLGILVILVITSIISGANKSVQVTPRVINSKTDNALDDDEKREAEEYNKTQALNSKVAIDTYFPPPLDVAPIDNGQVGTCPAPKPQTTDLPYMNVPMYSLV